MKDKLLQQCSLEELLSQKKQLEDVMIKEKDDDFMMQLNNERMLEINRCIDNFKKPSKEEIDMHFNGDTILNTMNTMNIANMMFGSRNNNDESKERSH